MIKENESLSQIFPFIVQHFSTAITANIYFQGGKCVPGISYKDIINCQPSRPFYITGWE